MGRLTTKDMVFNYLGENPGSTSDDIAGHLGKSRPAINAALRPLHDDGLIEKYIPPKNGQLGGKSFNMWKQVPEIHTDPIF